MLKLTLRGLVAHKLRFVLTAIAVILGVAFVSGTLVFTDTVNKAVDDLFANVYEGTDAYVRSANSIDNPFGGDEQRERIADSTVSEVRAVPGVAVAEAQIEIQRAQYLDKRGKPIGNPSTGSPTLGFNYLESPELDPFRLVPHRGQRSRAPRTSDEVVMDLGTAKEAGFRIGDQVVVTFTNAKVPRDRYRIVGTVKFGDQDRPLGATVALFTLAEAQRVNDTPGRIDGVSAAGESGLSETELAGRIRRSLAGDEFQVITGSRLVEENQDQVQQGFSNFSVFLQVFAYIALFVGSFIIVNTFSIVIAQRTRELALLRALGASSRQVRSSVLIEALVIGFVAAAIGVGAGIGLAVALRGVMSAFGFDLPPIGLVITAKTVVLGLVLGVVVTFVSAFLPARRAARISPMAALRDAATESRQLGRRVTLGVAVSVLALAVLAVGLFGGGGIAAVGFGVFGLFVGVAVLGPAIARPVGRVLGAPLVRWRGTPGTLARENAVRNPRRTSSTAAALMIGVALVALISIFAASIKTSIGAQIDRAFRGDLVVLGDAGPGSSFSPAMAGRIGDVPGVEAAVPLRFGPFELDGEGQFIVASPPAEMDAVFDLRPRGGDFAGLGPNQIAVSAKALEDRGWRLGQSITAKFPVGGEQPLTIGAVFGFGQREGLSDYFMSIAAYDRRFTERADAQVYIALDPGASIREVKPKIAKVVKQFPGAEVNDISGLKRQFESQINQALGLVFALLFLAILIALLGIMNTLLLSIVERTREIGLLRAVGMSRRQLRSTVRWEAVIVSIFGAGLGIILGVFFGWAMFRALRDEGFTDFALPVGQLVAVVVLAALAGVAAAAYPAWRAAKLDVLDAISTE